MALPMRFVLKDVIVATLAGSTIEIPYSYVVVPDESESYADFVNISANIRSLAEKAAKSLDIPRLEGAPVVSESFGFTDIPEGIWYESAVNWAKKNHIVNGYSEEEFAPEDHISREQIATIMYRYAIYKRYNTDCDREKSENFADSAQVSDYAAAAVRYAASCGLMNGKTETEFKPQDEATRAELAAILERFAADNG